MTTLLHINRETVDRYRMHTQLLSPDNKASSPIDAARHLCGFQAQIPAAAEQSIAARCIGLRQGYIDEYLYVRRELVRTWLMRGTVHIVDARDLSLFSAAVGAAGVKELHRWLGRHGLNDVDIDRAADAIVLSLENGPLTRRELADRVVERLGKSAREWIEHSWGGIVKQTALDGRVCFADGTHGGGRFALTAQWLRAPQSSRDPDEALVEVAERYLQAYGPASPASFSRWAGIGAADARRAVHLLGAQVMNVHIQGRRAIALESTVETLSRLHSAELITAVLPSFDPLIVGAPEKHEIVSDEHYKSVFRKAGWITPVVVLNGHVAGTWTLHRTSRTIQIVVKKFDDDLTQHAISRATDWLSTYFERPVSIEWT